MRPKLRIIATVMPGGGGATHSATAASTTMPASTGLSTLMMV
jgi:hypothetical protein